jgi:hypothetical protein
MTGTDRGRRPALRTYRTLLACGALEAVALAVTTIARGDLQSALAAVAVVSGGAFLLSLTRLLAMGGRSASRARLSATPT